MTMLERFCECLLAHFGPQHWWPVMPETPPDLAAWEVAVGAVLTQNTNWRNVETALAALALADCLAPTTIAAMDPSELATLIRSSGYFNVKAKRLQALAEWWLRRQAWAQDPANPLADVRQDLLAVNGVGPETADSILLYALGRPTFVIDAYTKRVACRHQLIRETAGYGEVQNMFVPLLPVDVELYKEYHALIVMLAKQYCRTKPQCEGCPLQWHMASIATSP